LLHCICVQYICLPRPAVQTLRAPDPEISGRVGRARRGAEDERPRQLLLRLHEKDPVQNPVVPARLWTFIDSYLSPFL